MKIVTWNVNGIRARQDRVLAWIEANHPDVLCLQEIKIENEKFPIGVFEEKGYHVTLYGQKAYNGVAILSRAAVGDIERGFADGNTDQQARFLAATTAQGVRVVSVYVPNGESLISDKFVYKKEWLKRLHDYLTDRIKPGDRWALCGDFNIAPTDIDVYDPIAWQGHVLCSAEERAALTRLCEIGFVDLLRHLSPDRVMYTWWDYRALGFPKNQGLRIDHVLATPALAAQALSIEVDREERKGKQPSDHAPVVATFGDP